MIQPQRRSLFCFFAWAFVISWSVWIPAALASYGLLAWTLPPVLTGLLGAFGPVIAALITTIYFDGKAGVQVLFQRLLIWRVGWRWYAFVLAWPVCLSLTQTLLSVLLGSAMPDFTQPPFVRLYPLPPEVLATIPPWLFLPVIFVQQMLIGSSMGEEPGWRSYALPRLQARYNPWLASLILGSLWGLWHFPLWLTQGQARPTAGLGWSALELIATTLLFTWVYNHTQGSLLLALLFHTAIGLTGLFLGAAAGHPLIEVTLTWTVALWVTWRSDKGLIYSTEMNGYPSRTVGQWDNARRLREEQR